MDTPLAQEKPREATLATNLLWTSLGLGLINSAFQFSYLKTQAPVGFILVVAGLTLAVMALLVYFISQGRNWARITFLVLFLIGLIPWFPQLVDTFSRSTLSGLLTVAQVVLQVVALYLIFSKPGAGWFAKRVGSEAAS